jgi:cold shock CspA family protein/ribosomal protein L37AE/L43A
MIIGLVKWYDANKGFGIVSTPNEEEYFLHLNSFISKPEKILQGTPIAFSPKIDETKNRKSAYKSRIVGLSEDWKTIFSYMSKSDIVRMEIEVTGYSKFGNKYHRKEIQSLSLVGISLTYFFKNKNVEELKNIIIEYFHNDLDSKHFIQYCEQISKALPKYYTNKAVNSIQDSLFTYFGNNLNDKLLFNVWKEKKFKFIAYNELVDHEIPENILKAFILEISKLELYRIQNYSYGTKFCKYYVNNKFQNLENLTSADIKELYRYIEFETKEEQIIRKLHLDRFYAQKIETELSEKVVQLETIRNGDDFNNYNRLLQLIPNQLSVIEQTKITDSIHIIIAQKCSDEYKAELWVKGIIKEILFELVEELFFNKDTQTEKRISILSKLESHKQFELIKGYSARLNFESAFELLIELLKKENSFDYDFDISKVLLNKEFWKEKKGGELIELLTGYVVMQSDDKQKYELFLKGFIKIVPLTIVRQNINKLEHEDCKIIFNSISENKPFICELLIEKISLEKTNTSNWIYDLAIEFLDEQNFNIFDKSAFETIAQSEYFKFWEKGKAKIFPKIQIESILQDKFENYTKISKWIENNATSTDEISNFLISFLLKKEIVSDKIIFYTQINHIKYLLKLNELNVEKIKNINNDFYNISLWVLEKDNFFDFELLKQKFIYFAPNEQIRIIRKLFYLKAKGQFDLTIEKLEQLTRFDLDLYKSNLKFNPDIPIDISTDVVIKTILSYKKNNRFFLESEILNVILNDIILDKTRRFQLTNYFEKCIGRLTAEYDWSRNGEITKVKFGENKFYYAISFEYDPQLIEAVKSLPGRKWNNEIKVWGVPSQYESEVLNFAKEYRFFLNFEGNNYTNNLHFAQFKRTKTLNYTEYSNIPSGIVFCEGRLANKPHEIYKKEFWWCSGQPCLGKCETIHKADDWEKYTLLDFCEILGLNTDETNKMGDFIPKGLYYQFIALINRFNRLLEKLYCQDCNHILYPSDFGTGHFAAHTLVRFQCRNSDCPNREEIYLNHCFNGQCNSIIDSRVSKRCENGLFICDSCGSCCSHKMLERRLSNLKLTGGYIHDNLVKCVYEKLGHLERGEYFCFKCKSEMSEISNDIFHCSNCNVKYDTTQYKINRPNLHLRKLKKTTEKNENDNYDFDFPI